MTDQTYRLQLVHTDDGTPLLYSTEPSERADYSLFYLDGSGGCPFDVAPNKTWESCFSPPRPYTADGDDDGFHRARLEVLASSCVIKEEYGWRTVTDPAGNTVEVSKDGRISMIVDDDDDALDEETISIMIAAAMDVAVERVEGPGDRWDPGEGDGEIVGRFSISLDAKGAV